MIKLNKHEQQIILACKEHGEWAKIEDSFKAVKVVLADYFGLDVEKLRNSGVYEVLYDLVYKIDPSIIKRISLNMMQDSWTGEWKQSVDIKHMIKKYISELSCLRVVDDKGNKLFEKLEADYSILNKGLEEFKDE